jgi:hypothetical protein
MTIKAPFGPGVEMTFNLCSPPQADSDRVFELARLQLMGFFYWITFSADTNKGGFWLGEFYPVLEAVRSDWGNPVHLAFMRQASTWDLRLLVVTADGFFKATIRRHPVEVCWSWALEWNHNLRVVGFFGEREPVLAAAKALPRLKVKTIAQGPGHALRYRMETPLSDDDDQMFLASRLLLATPNFAGPADAAKGPPRGCPALR